MSKQRAAVELFMVSALGLFVELIFIRWAGSEVRLIAYYKNFALIAAFLGLGLGFAYRRFHTNKLFERYFFPLLTASVLILLLLGRTSLNEMILLNRTNAQEYIWAGTIDITNSFANLFLDFSFYAILFLLFGLITILFIPIGELTARKFVSFSPLPGYTINILGSLFGILFYTMLSFLETPPTIWYLFTAVIGIYFIAGVPRKQFVTQVALAVAPLLLTLFWPTGSARTLWSPYYRIDLDPVYAKNDNDLLLGYELSVNKAWHQRLWNLGREFVNDNYANASQHFDDVQAEYDAPFAVSIPLQDVLIVGAGTGNDVAAAIRAGAENITAVEIDPTILRIGRELHSEKPYANPNKVKTIVQDARSYFKRAEQKFDLIVFGRLDSHTLFSSASSVRLDNFVYTQESIHDVRMMLKEGGLIALSYGVPGGNEWVGERIFRTLTDEFGYQPQVYQFNNGDKLFVIGTEQFESPIINIPGVTYLPNYRYRSDLSPATDNWPYLYLQSKTIPNTYIIGLIGVMLISLLLIRRTIPDFRQVNLHFFFLGAAFFLLETKSITEMALLFGSTWIVNAAVIASILVMIVIANLIVLGRKLTNPTLFYILLFLSLGLNYLIPVNSYLDLPMRLRIILAITAQALPLFFAGIIFAISFSKTKSIENALGSNLLGSVLGGVCEYASLALGVSSLYLLAMGYYFLSAAAYYRMKKPKMQPIPS